jgi:hypothetical protein
MSPMIVTTPKVLNVVEGVRLELVASFAGSPVAACSPVPPELFSGTASDWNHWPALWNPAWLKDPHVPIFFWEREGLVFTRVLLTVTSPAC